MTDLGVAPPRDLGGQSGVDVDIAVRSVLFVIPFLMHWISLHPFIDLSVIADPETLHGGDRINQIGFTTLFAAMTAWALLHGVGRLKLLLRPTLVIIFIWFVLTAFVSWEPLLSFRRLAFAIIIMVTAAVTLLLPKNLRHFCDLLVVVVLLVLAVCYIGVLIAPSLSVHQLTDVMEPEHAGSWRGVFKHKNEAGGVMLVFVCVGLFIARARSLVMGGLIVVLAAVFLVFTQSKTAIALLPFVLMMSSLVVRLRTLRSRIAITVAVLAFFNLIAVGSIYFEPIHAMLTAVTSDATFTGRTDIWQFAVDQLMRRPITGFGFLAFWGTDEVMHGLSESGTWATAATDAHNAYLNIALGAGFPGMVMVTFWIVVLPMVDFHRAPLDGDEGLLATLFLRIWLFGIFGSCFESIFFKSGGEPWFAVLIAIWGLRMLSSSRLTR